MKIMERFGKYFYGNEISEYGQKNGFVDYKTLAKAFDAVLNNNIMNATCEVGYWDQESGFIDHSEEIEEIEERIFEIENEIEEIENAILYDGFDNETGEADIERLSEEKEELESKKEELDDDQYNCPEIFQYYIVSDQGAEILKEFNEIVFYNDSLDMYVWGVTHWGTSWDYVLTDIPCEKIA